MNKRIVISGIGVISPYGLGSDIFFDNLVEGKSGISTIEKFDTGHFLSKKAGHIKSDSLKKYLKNSNLLRAPFLSQLALISADCALKDARYKIDPSISEKIGVFISTEGTYLLQGNIYDMIVGNTIEEVKPRDFQEVVINAPASHITISQRIKGPSIAFAEGLSALYTSLLFLNNNKIDNCLVGAVDEFVKVHHEAYSCLKVLSPNNGEDETCRPFDKSRNGIIMAESGGFVHIETIEQAKKRESNSYAEILSMGMASDACRIADNDPEGIGFEKAMKNAISAAGIDCKEIDWIAAAANGSDNIDKGECRAVKKIFGRCTDTPISSIKSSMGWSKCAGGILNLIAGIKAIQKNSIPPTTNHVYGDDEFELDYVPNKARQKEINTVLVNSALWGGIYCSLIIRKVN